MIPEKEKIDIRPVSNGWVVKMCTWCEEEHSWIQKYEYVFQENEILLDELKKHIMSSKSIDAVYYGQ